LTTEFRCRTNTGTWKWVEETATNLLEEPGVRAVVANYRDITDRRRAEEAGALMASIVESSHDAIISQTLDGTILTWNVAAERIYGYSAQDAIGQRVTFIVPENRRHEYESILQRLRLGEEIRSHETERVRKDGQHIQISATLSPIRNTEGRIIGASGISRDITLEKQTIEQIHRSRKMDAVMRVANAVSHDFSNALTIILGYCDLMSRSHYPTTNLPRDLERIRRTAEKTADLARQMLAFGGKRTAVPQVLDLNIQIMKIEAMLPKLLHENIKLVLRLTRQPAIIKADPQLVDQLIVNLAVNALEAMPERGHLSIETSNLDIHETKITRSGFVPPGSYVCLTVKDTGKGMTPEIIQHLYEPFFSTKPREGHLGLGLAMVYSVVTQSGGHIDAHSEPGRGTTFDIYLPRHEVAQRTDFALKRARSMGTETILIAEDDPILREVAVEYLTSLGYFVLESQDCAHAMELCRDHSSAVDLLLTDIVMPDMSGPTLAEHIREISPRTKVLFMSGYPNVDVPHSSFRGSDLHFLSKPFNAAELGEKVRSILDASF
jgi:two-component system cell cycle sensor histidine kinase/response regulator CckA